MIDLIPYVKLQIAGAADLDPSRKGRHKLTVRCLYQNLRNYVPDFSISYSEFLDFLNQNRQEFDMASGEIGLNVNLIGLKDV